MTIRELVKIMELENDFKNIERLIAWEIRKARYATL